MGLLFQELQRLIARDQYVIGLHAAERLEDRGIMDGQVVSGVSDGELILERPSAH